MSTENKQMIKRLETVAPMYRMSNWVDDWQRKEELTSMITAYPENLAAAIPVAKKVHHLCTSWDLASWLQMRSDNRSIFLIGTQQARLLQQDR